MKYILTISSLLALTLLLALPAGGADLALGSEGQVLQLRSGVYGELFPNGTEADREASVLAVEFIGAETRRSLVPSTADLSPEYSPTLYHDPNVDITYVLWSSRHNGVHPYLRLAQYAGGSWNETLDITGSVFAVKSDPQLSVHHESWTVGDERVERTVFHVQWWEELGNSVHQRLSALVLENGNLVGSTGILTLEDYVAEDPDAPRIASGLASTVRMLTSESGIVVGFLAPDGKLEILSSEVLPAALSRLAVAVEQAILGFDAAAGLSLEESVVETMLDFADDFHPVTLTAMVESVLELIQEAEDPGTWLGSALNDLAGKAMPHMIEIGARMKSGGLVGQDVSVVTVEPDELVADAQVHHLALSNIATFTTPDSLPEGTQLFISRRGTAALLAWDDGDLVAYRETTADGWSELSHIDTTKGVDRATAYQILEERTLER